MHQSLKIYTLTILIISVKIKNIHSKNLINSKAISRVSKERDADKSYLYLAVCFGRFGTVWIFETTRFWFSFWFRFDFYHLSLKFYAEKKLAKNN